jgi:GntR family transcriptional regulator, N-acetylglucosamine utilization regulator
MTSTTMSPVSRHAPIPLYHQVKNAVLRDIEAGHWGPGEQLPTENELIARFHVSKITVRQALRELAQMGYIRREQGRGTFVQHPPLEEGPRELTSFTGEMRGHGLAARSLVLEQGTLSAPADVALWLEIDSGAPVFCLRRLRLANGEPMGLQTAYLPTTLVPGIEDLSFADDSLYEVLASRYSLYPAKARETHQAVLVAAEEAALLRVDPGAPALAAERLTSLASGQPLEYVQSIMRGDRYRIVLDLVRATR